MKQELFFQIPLEPPPFPLFEMGEAGGGGRGDFAFDVFDEQLGFWRTFLALLLHLLPYVATFRGFEWFAYALVAGLPVLIGLLFLAGWIWRKPIREG